MMRRHFAPFAVAMTLLMRPAAALPEPAAQDDLQLYATAVKTMRGLPEPPYLTFVVNVTSEGLRSVELRDNDGVGVLRVFSGRGGASGSWPVNYRERDDLASITNGPLSHLLTHSPVFIPTWTGAYEWFRFGLDGRPILVSATAQPSAALPQASASPATPNLAVIGSVTAVSPGAYRITAANPDTCPGSEQGRHLHLEPRDGDTKMHPLTDVTIDLASTRFCSVRFVLPLRGARGFSKLHFGNVNGYWMTTSDDADITGLLVKAKLHIRYDEIRFPNVLDEASIFTLTAAKKPGR
jgi:hypothetical protein